MAKFEQLTLSQQTKVRRIAEIKGVPISAVIAALQIKLLDKLPETEKGN